MVSLGRIQTKVAACIIACPKVEVGNLVFISNGRAINWRPLMKDSAKLFGYEYEPHDAQYLSLLTCNSQ